MNDAELKNLRAVMVRSQIASRGITDQSIIKAFKNVPRHLFIPHDKRVFSYDDCPLPIGEDQTISQPYMVALMSAALRVKAGMKVLEVGTGSGYQAAILAYLGAQVYSIERISSLAQRAGQILEKLKYEVKVSVGDGTLGWAEHSPYDRIIVTAASPEISPSWVEQLRVGGLIVLPIGDRWRQELVVVTKHTDTEIEQERVCGCVFVPLIGKYGFKE